jgi:uncharacterized protein DUF6515
VVQQTTYYHYNPWYRRALYEGEEVYVLTSPPVGYEVEQLPQVEAVTVNGTRFYYDGTNAAFYQDAGEKFVVAAAPTGAEVTSIPKDARVDDQEGSDLVIFDNTYFTRTTNSAGKTVYQVEPQPPAEELQEIPQGSVSFVADDETYYYVNYNLYVQYSENGKTGYVNGEPELGAQVDKLPEGVTAIEENGKTYQQFDMVFFEEVQDGSGKTFYEVVDSPDGSESVEI